MMPVWWMTGASLLSWLAVAAVVDRQAGLAALLGMLGPLAAAAGTWLLVERAHRRRPAQLTALMVAAFGAKMVLFGAYVTVMLRGLSVRPLPFIVSFTSYFIALHLTEAMFLRRLFAPNGSDSIRR